MLVVFVDHAECRWLRVLRAGFRHCFVVIRDRSVWLACDPLKDRIELSSCRYLRTSICRASTLAVGSGSWEARPGRIFLVAALRSPL